RPIIRVNDSIIDTIATPTRRSSDIGKADRRFQKKINKKPKLKVKHSAAGAKFFNQFVKNNYLTERGIAKDDHLLFAEYVDVISYVILSHQIGRASCRERV